VRVDEELRRPSHTGRHIVYLDPTLDRAVSPYSPEGEIKMMGDFAAGLSRRGAVSRPMALLLVALILAPIVLSVLAMLTAL
jgi:membrane-associated PAP2 superfamily phosphatase